MWQYRFDAFGLENLRAVDVPVPEPGPGEVRLAVHAISLNYRDALVVAGSYNPKLTLPAVPVSDAAGVIDAVGPNVEAVRVGDEVVTVFVPGWLRGQFQEAYLKSTLGTPGPGMAAQYVVLPAAAVLPKPPHLAHSAAAALTCTYLTAWSCLVTEGGFDPADSEGKTVLTLGTGGLSIAVVQLAKAMGARVAITSSSDEKLARARALGADITINYRTDSEWGRTVATATQGGADIVVDTAGRESLPQSLRAVRAGGMVAVLGALSGLTAEVNTGLIMMRRIRLVGIMVDSRAAFQDLLRFVSERRLEPVIDRVEPFDRLPIVLRDLPAGGHFGKIVLS